MDNSNKKFNINDFNKNFDNNQKKNIQNINVDIEDINTIQTILPHKKPIEIIILEIQDLFFIILEIIIDKKNPIPFILSSDNRIFLFSIFLLLFGSLLLLLASLMESK
jgi:hypothetical protein